MRKIRLLDEAVIEAMEAASWYEKEWPSLGVEFAEALDAALDLLENEIVPLTVMRGEPGLHGFKRLILPVFLSMSEAETLVVAVAHQAR